MASLTFKKAERSAVKIKILIDGPSGSGKTWGALSIAEGLAAAEGGRIAMIDSERGRASLYADRFDFDALNLDDRHPDRYTEALEAAIEAGYPVVVLDSLSHAWQNVLDRKDAYERENPRANRWTAWGLPGFAPAWERLLDAVLRSNVHVICTARSKESYEQRDENGKKSVVKLGMQPQVRDGTVYEFALAFSVEQSHRAVATKDNTHQFPPTEEMLNLGDGSVPARLLEWLKDAKPIDIPDVETVSAINAAIRSLPEGVEPRWRKAWAQKRLNGCTEFEAQEILNKVLAEAEKHAGGDAPAPKPPAARQRPQTPSKPPEEPKPAAEPPAPASAPAPAASVPEPKETGQAQVPPAKCPKCGGAMWDNRTAKRSPRAPDWKCKDKGCDGLYWPGQWPPKPKDAEQTDMLEQPAQQDGDGLDHPPAGVAAFEQPDDDLPF